jgi:hypothetical protein
MCGSEFSNRLLGIETYIPKRLGNFQPKLEMSVCSSIGILHVPWASHVACIFLQDVLVGHHSSRCLGLSHLMDCATQWTCTEDTAQLLHTLGD